MIEGTIRRNITDHIVHHSATYPDLNVDIRNIRREHIKRGFDDVGYHYFIKKDGTIQMGRSLARKGAHCLNRNARSIGTCLEGGIDMMGNPENNFTAAQIISLKYLDDFLHRVFPNMNKISGHKDHDPVNKPDCPMLDLEFI